MDLEQYIPRPIDPNAPKTLDMVAARRLVQQAERFARQPMGEYMLGMAGQLGLALNALAGGDAKVLEAQASVTRYKQEADTANAEVRTMQGMLTKAREERDAALQESAALRAERTVAEAAAAAKPKAARKSKVVSMPDQGQKAAQ